MPMPDDPKAGSWRQRRDAGWVATERSVEPRVEAAATPHEIRETIRRLRRRARFHFAFAAFFVFAAAFSFSQRPSMSSTRSDVKARADLVTEDIFQWEVVLMSLGLAIVNLVLALSKGRRATRLAVDPDADQPEAKVFE